MHGQLPDNAVARICAFGSPIEWSVQYWCWYSRELTYKDPQILLDRNQRRLELALWCPPIETPVEFLELLLQMPCLSKGWSVPVHKLYRKRCVDRRTVHPCSLHIPHSQTWPNLPFGPKATCLVFLFQHPTERLWCYTLDPFWCYAHLTLFDVMWGPIFAVNGVHCTMVRFCWAHNVHLGLFQRSNAGALLLAELRIQLYDFEFVTQQKMYFFWNVIYKYIHIYTYVIYIYI